MRLKTVVIFAITALVLVEIMLASTTRWENNIANQMEANLTSGLDHEELEEMQQVLEKLQEQRAANELKEDKINEEEGIDSDEQTMRNFYEDITTITDTNSYLVLVNKNNRLRSDYVPIDLRAPSVFDIRYQANSAELLRAEAAQMLEQLFQAASDEAGLTLLVSSGYRSYERQTIIYQNYVRELGQEAADRFSARPGHSEHQTGLAMDVTADSVGRRLLAEFGDTPEGIWLAENAHRFGFIIRYPRGRELDTGYIYEPWHIRYVGIEAATEIYENDLILEEYLGQW